MPYESWMKPPGVGVERNPTGPNRYWNYLNNARKPSSLVYIRDYTRIYSLSKWLYNTDQPGFHGGAEGLFLGFLVPWTWAGYMRARCLRRIFFVNMFVQENSGYPKNQRLDLPKKRGEWCCDSVLRSLDLTNFPKLPTIQDGESFLIYRCAFLRFRYYIISYINIFILYRYKEDASRYMSFHEELVFLDVFIFKILSLRKFAGLFMSAFEREVVWFQREIPVGDVSSPFSKLYTEVWYEYVWMQSTWSNDRKTWKTSTIMN